LVELDFKINCLNTGLEAPLTMGGDPSPKFSSISRTFRTTDSTSSIGTFVNRFMMLKLTKVSSPSKCIRQCSVWIHTTTSLVTILMCQSHQKSLGFKDQ
jgi:hypothetical protein